MSHSRSLLVGAAALGLVAVLGVGQAALEVAGRQQGVMAPAFESTPLAETAPNHWVLGSTIGVGSTRRTMFSSSIGLPT
jgi:hypothetical protein